MNDPSTSSGRTVVHAIFMAMTPVNFRLSMNRLRAIPAAISMTRLNRNTIPLMGMCWITARTWTISYTGAIGRSTTMDAPFVQANTIMASYYRKNASHVRSASSPHGISVSYLYERIEPPWFVQRTPQPRTRRRLSRSTVAGDRPTS